MSGNDNKHALRNGKVSLERVVSQLVFKVEDESEDINNVARKKLGNFKQLTSTKIDIIYVFVRIFFFNF